jgi:uncharacterized RDD family membrane protein YckC
MTEGSIEFACPYCDRVTRVPAVYGGKQGKCPGCQKVIEVPDPAAEAGPGAAPPTGALDVTVIEPPPLPPPVAAPEPEAIGSPVTEAAATWKGAVGAPVGVVAAAAATPDVGKAEGPERPCPSCGEQIKTAAKKCKFCGEFLDAGLRAQRRGAVPVPVGKLASPWTRFVAVVLDFLLGYVPSTMIIGVGVVVAEQTRTEAFGIIGGILGFLWLLTYHVYSWYLIATRGQNITKRWFGIKIVKLDGQPVDFVSGVLLRNWVMFFVALFVPCYLGHLVNWAGYLAIFSDDRRCLHDHIASTVVVEV